MGRDGNSAGCSFLHLNPGGCSPNPLLAAYTRVKERKDPMGYVTIQLFD